jgi:surfeit locus 1 family protein
LLNAPQRRWLVALAALAAVALTGRLGLWQLDRAAQKTALQAAIDGRAQLPALTAEQLASSDEDATAQHHRRIRLQGRWQAEHTVYLDNRQMAGRPGFFVVTPLLLADGRAVLVQRGWMPRDAMDRSRLAEVPTPATAVDVHGRIAPAPARLYEFEGGEQGRIRQNIDIDALARQTGLQLLPLSVLQEDAPQQAADGLRRQWPVPSTGIHTHHGYAFQWFALCALIAGLYVWFQLIVPRRRAR